jgi:hypothetical protein
MIRILMPLLTVLLLLPTASRGQTPAGDSYLCHKAGIAPHQEKFPPVQITLEDQFGTFLVDVKGVLSMSHSRGQRRLTVCNPIQTAARPDAHQIGYTIAIAKTPLQPQPRFVKTDHRVFDQFGTHALTVVKPVSLRAPSAMVRGAGGTETVDTAGVDHFNCYKVVPAKNAAKFVAPPLVAITDEFGTVDLMLKRITSLCTPVNMNGEDTTAPQHVGNLVCYQAKLPGGTTTVRQTVSVNDTIMGSAVLVTMSVAELCVPAFMDTLPTPVP